jgi:hypothetical protein
MSRNYRDTAKLFFNSKTGKNYKAWSNSIAAYFNLLSGKNKRNYVDALNAYYTGVQNGTIVPPPTVVNGATVVMANSVNNKTVNGTAVVTAGVLTRVSAPANTAIVTSAQTLTGVTPSGTYTNTVTFTVANGVITAIALS